MRHSARLLVAVAAFAAAGAAGAQQTVTLKMQATWPASLTLYENFTYFAERVVLDSQHEYASKVVPAKRFYAPPYSFAANYYWPEHSKPAAKGK